MLAVSLMTDEIYEVVRRVVGFAGLTGMEK